MPGRRFIGRSLRSLGGMLALGRLAARLDDNGPDPAEGDHLGAIRGEVRTVRGPRASSLYTEWFPPAEEGGPTIVFTHGLCLTEAVWHYQKRDLCGGPYGAVTWDLPGHGHSDRIAPGELTQEMGIDALARVVETYAGANGVVLVGHSLGGTLTLGYLARHAEAARERVLGAVIVSTPLVQFAHSVAGRWPGAGLEARIMGKAVRYLVESDLVDRRLARDVGTDLDTLSYRVVRVGFGKHASPTQVRYVRDVIASVPPQVRADAYRAMTAYDVRSHLGRVEHPILVVIGEEDRLVDPEESRTLATSLPGAEVLGLEDVGHAPFLEAPEAFNDAVLAFARRLSRSEADTA
ncbi:MAG TPA: alpha/beta hydrolase [Actinomycetota bacterium]